MTQNTRRTTIEQYEENGSWKASEPDAPHNLVGRGATPAEATAHYAELVHETYFGGEQEVPADD